MKMGQYLLCLLLCLSFSTPLLAGGPPLLDSVSKQIAQAATAKKKKKKKSSKNRAKNGKCKKGYRENKKGVCKKPLFGSGKSNETKSGKCKKGFKRNKKGLCRKKLGKAIGDIAKGAGKIVTAPVRTITKAIKFVNDIRKCIKKRGGRNDDARTENMDASPGDEMAGTAESVHIDTEGMKGVNVDNALKKIWDRFRSTVNKKAKSKKRMKILACVLKAADPKVQKMLTKAGKALKKMKKKIVKTWNTKVMPKLMKAVFASLKKELSGKKSLKKVASNAREIAGELLLKTERVKALSKAFKDYTAAIKDKNMAKADAAYKKLEGLLSKTKKLGSKIIIGVFKRVLREQIYKIVDEKVAPLVERAIKGLSTGVAMAEGMLDSLSGLVPIIGATIGTVVSRGFRIIWDHVLEGKLRKKALDKIKEKVDDIINMAGGLMQKHIGDKVDAKVDAAEKRLGSIAGKLRSVIQQLSALVLNDELKSFIAANQAYEEDLLLLIRAARPQAAQ